MQSTDSPHQDLHKEDEPPPLAMFSNPWPWQGGSCETSETLHSRAIGGESCQNTFRALHDSIWMWPISARRREQSNKEPQRQHNKMQHIRTKKHWVVSSFIPQSCRSSLPKSHQLNITRLEASTQDDPIVFPEKCILIWHVKCWKEEGLKEWKQTRGQNISIHFDFKRIVGKLYTKIWMYISIYSFWVNSCGTWNSRTTSIILKD